MSRQNKRPLDLPEMPTDYPVVTLSQALADGTEPWTLRVIANRLGRHYPRHAYRLRRVAEQLAASNDNSRRDSNRQHGKPHAGRKQERRAA